VDVVGPLGVVDVGSLDVEVERGDLFAELGHVLLGGLADLGELLAGERGLRPGPALAAAAEPQDAEAEHGEQRDADEGHAAPAAGAGAGAHAGAVERTRAAARAAREAGRPGRTSGGCRVDPVDEALERRRERLAERVEVDTAGGGVGSAAASAPETPCASEPAYTPRRVAITYTPRGRSGGAGR
jgi:hypothetical protein